MSENKGKTHYRRVFKSEHLGVADLEEMLEDGKRLVFTIKHVKQEYGVAVAGKKGDHNIAYFVESIKPLVLNSTNSKMVKGFCKNSPFVEDWVSVAVELYADPNVRMKGEAVGGVRIKPNQPKMTKPELTPTHKNWDKAKESVKAGNSDLKSISKNWVITQENYDLLCL